MRLLNNKERIKLDTIKNQGSLKYQTKKNDNNYVYFFYQKKKYKNKFGEKEDDRKKVE